MKKQLFFLLFISFFSFNASSQSGNLLTDFINKNDLILRSVHKQMYHDANSRDEASFKRLITAQVAAIQLSSTNPSKAAQYAYLVRTESMAFMKKHTKGNLDYYTITSEEIKTLELSKPDKLETDFLDKSLLNNIQSLKVTDMNVFNSFTTSIR